MGEDSSTDHDQAGAPASPSPVPAEPRGGADERVSRNTLATEEIAPGKAEDVSALPVSSTPAPAPAESNATGETREHPGTTPEGVYLSSRRRLRLVGLAIAVFNPLPAGLIIGVYLWREGVMRKEGQLVIAVSLAWGALILTVTGLSGQRW